MNELSDDYAATKRAAQAESVWGEEDGSHRWELWRRGTITPAAEQYLHSEFFDSRSGASARAQELMRQHRRGKVALGFLDVRIRHEDERTGARWVTTALFTAPDESARERVIRAAEALKRQNPLTYYFTVNSTVRAEVNRRATARREASSV